VDVGGAKGVFLFLFLFLFLFYLKKHKKQTYYGPGQFAIGSTSSVAFIFDIWLPWLDVIFSFDMSIGANDT